MDDMNNQNLDDLADENNSLSRTNDSNTGTVSLIAKIIYKITKNPKGILIGVTVIFVAIISIILLVNNGNNNDNNNNETSEEVHTPYEAFTFYPQSSDTYVVAIAPEGKYYSEIVIPSTYNGKNVVEIAKEGFKECEELESITIPNTIKKIGENAFEGCTDLRTLTLSAPLTIGIYAFKSTYISTVYFNGSLEEWLEVNCYGAVEIPLFTGWDTKLYLNNQLLTDLDFTDISRCDDAYIFGGLDSIKSVTIPEGYYSCPYFGGCSSLETVTIHDSVKKLSGFENCTSLKNITIPSHVTGIYKEDFRGCSSLETISIPNTIEKIGDSAFYGCYSLKSITIPESVTTIGEGAFQNCSSLETVVFTNPTTEIQRYAFKNCSKLKNITLPRVLLEIKEGTFYGCESLTEIALPSTICATAYQAFMNCTSLESVEFQGPIITIAEKTFEGCSALTDIFFAGDKFMWNYTVNKYTDWNKDTGNYIVHCTDGILYKNN